MEVAEGIRVEELADPGTETLQRFLVAWHGPRQPDYGIPPEHLVDQPIPRPLRDWYGLAGRWPGVIRQNRLLEPSELEEVEGRVVFYVENQNVWFWATASEGEDPVVWSRENAPDARWEREGEPLSRFLLQLVLFEALWAGPEGVSAPWLNEEQ